MSWCVVAGVNAYWLKKHSLPHPKCSAAVGIPAVPSVPLCRQTLSNDVASGVIGTYDTGAWRDMIVLRAVAPGTSTRVIETHEGDDAASTAFLPCIGLELLTGGGLLAGSARDGPAPTQGRGPAAILPP
jgi:hypothetical protein